MYPSTIQEHRQHIAVIEREIATLSAERGSILAVDRPLRAGEVDRVYDINHEMEWCFERMAMHLPLREEETTADRWDPLTPDVIDSLGVHTPQLCCVLSDVGAGPCPRPSGREGMRPLPYAGGIPRQLAARLLI